MVVKRELVGFVSVGLAGAAIDFGFFNCLLAISWEPIEASTVSVTIAGIVVFFGNLFISFKHVQVSSKFAAALKFFILAVITILANNLLVNFLLSSSGASSACEMNLIKASVVVSLAAIRFFAMKYVVYVR